MKLNLVAIAVVSGTMIFGQAASAQSPSKPSPYAGVSKPPADDVITSTPDTPPPAPKAAPVPASSSPATSATAATTPQPGSMAPATNAQPTTFRHMAADSDADIMVTSLPRTPGSGPVHTSPAASDAELVTSVPSKPGDLSVGTAIWVRLHEDLSTTATTKGTPFSAQVTADVAQNGKVIIPRGSELSGRVVQVQAGKRVRGGAMLRLRPDVIVLPDGGRYMVHASVIGTKAKDTRADSEGGIAPGSHLKRNAAEYGIGAGTGAAVGAGVGGGMGALVGAGIGAGMVTTHLMLQDRQAYLPKDSVIVFGLTEPMSLAPIQN